MKKYTQPLKTDTYYHIYNRGINGEDIFKEERNYAYFLEKLTQFLIPSIEVYSYCLLKNHFHILISRSLTIIQLSINQLNRFDISIK